MQEGYDHSYFFISTFIGIISAGMLSSWASQALHERLVAGRRYRIETNRRMAIDEIIGEWPVPLYNTIVISAPVIDLNSSAAPAVSLPGSFFARAITSAGA